MLAIVKDMSEEKKVNFGFQMVNESEKENKVQHVFSDVASVYDQMNDLMSFGLHRMWKNKFIAQLHPCKDDFLLDLAGGTGDIAVKFIHLGGGKSLICDLNQEMLDHGIKKRIDSGLYDLPIDTICANAENLPFSNNTFDYCAIAFGIRNFTNIPAALQEIKRVLKPGGRFLCLEFSQLDSTLLKKFYDFYLFNVIPKLGKMVGDNELNYLYLSESIKLFPRAQELAEIIKQSGFEFVTYERMTFGIVAIHSGYKV